METVSAFARDNFGQIAAGSIEWELSFDQLVPDPKLDLVGVQDYEGGVFAYYQVGSQYFRLFQSSVYLK
jgi:hypothetical protein